MREGTLVVLDPNERRVRLSGCGWLAMGLALLAAMYVGQTSRPVDARFLPIVLCAALFPLSMCGLGVLFLNWRHVVELSECGDATERWSTLFSRRVVTHGRVSSCAVVAARDGGYELRLLAARTIRMGPYPTRANAERENERIAHHLQACEAQPAGAS